MMQEDVVRAATAEMTEACKEVYDRDGRIDTFVSGFGGSPCRQIVAIVDDHQKIPALAQYITMALDAVAVIYVAEVFVKDWPSDEPPADFGPGYLAAHADTDSSITTELIVTTMGVTRPGHGWTTRSAPSLDAHGRRVWTTTDEPDGDSTIYDYLTWAADHPMPGGPIATDDLERFVKELEANGLTPLAEVVGVGDG